MAEPENKKKKEEKKKLGLNVTGMLYPSNLITRDGNYHIGDYAVRIDKSTIPYSSRDSVDNYLDNLHKYLRDVSDHTKQVDMNNYFKYLKKDVRMFLPLPIPVEKRVVGGSTRKKRTTRNRRRSNHRKTGKSRK
jgi:hypothetical protein